MNNIKITTETISKPISIKYFHGQKTNTKHFQKLSPYNTETLYLLNNNSHLCLLSDPGNISTLYELDYPWVPHVKWNHTVFALCDWLILLSIKSSGAIHSIHVVACIRTSFLLRWNNIPLYVYHILFIHRCRVSSIFLASMKNAAWF